MGMALAALYLSVLGLNVAPCWGLFFLVALVAWPIWQHQQEVALFERRAILARIASESGRLRRWLWRGSAGPLAPPAAKGGARSAATGRRA